MREYEIEQQEMYYDGIESIYGEGLEGRRMDIDEFEGFNCSFLEEILGEDFEYKMDSVGRTWLEEKCEDWKYRNNMIER